MILYNFIPENCPQCDCKLDYLDNSESSDSYTARYKSTHCRICSVIVITSKHGYESLFTSYDGSEKIVVLNSFRIEFYDHILVIINRVKEDENFIEARLIKKCSEYDSELISIEKLNVDFPFDIFKINSLYNRYLNNLVLG